MPREKFASRLGFVLISAGCAIGLGNVYRFPFITGQYGGAAFVLIYLFFLVVLGLPIMAMEFSVGRASQKSCAQSFRILEPKGSKWHLYGWFAMLGNYLLMAFYPMIAGWILSYFVKMLRGDFTGLGVEQVVQVFADTTGNPLPQIFWLVVVVLLGFGVCSRGLQNGVEKITKAMMLCLLAIMLVLAVRSATLPGGEAGLAFYLKPNFANVVEQGVGTVVYAAMGQAFFTLSLGIGSMAIFGSYIGKDRALLGESISITLLDTFVAIMAGFIIFPACFAYGVKPDSGFGLIFVTLPNIFNHMAGGRLWGALFFIFMFFAAISTVIAVFENIISFAMDLWGWSRKKAVLVNIVLVILLSMPSLLGFNLLSGVAVSWGGIMGLVDFILSNNLLPLGSMVYLLFCVSRYGWGWDHFMGEVNTGKGVKFPKWVRFYVTWILPVMVFFIFVMGYWDKFAK